MHILPAIGIAGLIAGACLAAEAAPISAVISPSGQVTLSQGRTKIGDIAPGLFEDGWRGASLGASAGDDPAAGDRRQGLIKTSSGLEVHCELRPEVAGDSLTLHYTLTPRRDTKLNSFHVSLELPETLMAGGSWVADQKPGEFPDARDQTHLYNADTSAVKLVAADGLDLSLALLEPTPLLVQDNRQWGPTFSIRMGPQATPAREWNASESLEIAFTLTSTAGIQTEFDAPVIIAAADEWVPLTLDLDIVPGSALDFSAFGQIDAPAGKHGAIIATPAGDFAFADSPGTPRRFYGVNFCFSAHYITHEQSDRLAERLVRLGYNTVRFHHFEGMLVDRSGGQSVRLKPKELDQLDYLFAALKKRGIYITIDLFISRPVYASEVFPGAEGNLEMNEAKMLIPVNDRAFENWKAFSRNLLTHENPHTGLRWADDPALGWISMINEGNFGNFIWGLSDRARADWQRAWNKWLIARYEDRAGIEAAWGTEVRGDPAEDGVLLAGGTGVRAHDLALFLAETEISMIRRMREFLRDEIGTDALITNGNGWSNSPQSQLARQEYDYVDDHFYVDHPQFLEQSWRLPSRCGNSSPVAAGAPGGRYTAFTRLLDKPFTISEYNYSGPGRFRGVGGIITGCMAAVQGWDVVWRFAYSHNSSSLFEPGKANYFDLAGDPLNQAAERASLCLFLRGDLRPSDHTIAIQMTEEALRDPQGRSGGLSPSWNQLALVSRVGTYVGDHPDADLIVSSEGAPEGGGVLPEPAYSGEAAEAILAKMRSLGWIDEDNATDLKTRRSESEGGQLLVDAPRDVLVLNTTKTAGCYAPAGETVRAGAVTVAIEETDATIWVSSLDEGDISGSRRLLITHLTDLQNTGARFAERARQTLLAWGELPHLVRTGKALVEIANAAAADAEVYALATSGERLDRIDAQFADGVLTVPLSVAGPRGARIMYEVVIPQ